MTTAQSWPAVVQLDEKGLIEPSYGMGDASAMPVAAGIDTLTLPALVKLADG